MAYQRPDWAGVAVRFPGGEIMTIQLAWPEAVIEASYEYERGSIYDMPVHTSTRFRIELSGFATDWRQSGSGFHVPVAEIEARREIER